MSKFKLNLEELAVESFDTTHDSNRRGTVRGHDSDVSWMTDCLGAACGNTGECSVNSPVATQCDFSCEFACNATEAVGCTDRCPGGGGSNTCPPCGSGVTCYPESGCDFSCEFAC